MVPHCLHSIKAMGSTANIIKQEKLVMANDGDDGDTVRSVQECIAEKTTASYKDSKELAVLILLLFVRTVIRAQAGCTNTTQVTQALSNEVIKCSFGQDCVIRLASCTLKYCHLAVLSFNMFLPCSNECFTTNHQAKVKVSCKQSVDSYFLGEVST